MKAFLFLLACSLCANAYFAVAVLKLPHAAVANDGFDPSKEHSFPSNSAPPSQEVVQAAFQQGGTDPATLKIRLEEAGFPPDVVKAVVVAMVFDRYHARQREIMAGVDVTSYWRTGNAALGVTLGNPEAEQELAALRRASNDLIRTVYGSAYPEDEVSLAAARNYLGNLPVEKLSRLQRILGEYAELRGELSAGTVSSGRSPADLEKLALLAKEQEADIAALLTPAEYFEYEVRNSPLAQQLRYNLERFGPTEEEFRTLFAIQKEIEQRSPAATSELRVVGALDDAVRTELIDRLQSVLSPERLEDFDVATRREHLTLVRLANRLGLPPRTARDVARLQESATSAARSLRDDSALSPEQRAARLNALSAATHTRATELLGAKGVEAYLEYGGSWLSTLAAGDASSSASSL